MSFRYGYATEQFLFLLYALLIALNELSVGLELLANIFVVSDPNGTLTEIFVLVSSFVFGWPICSTFNRSLREIFFSLLRT